MSCCTLLYVHSSFAIILMGKRELVALLGLSSCCLVVVVWLFLAVPWVCLRFVIVVFPDHTHYFLLRLIPIINISHSRQFCSALMITFPLCHGSRELRRGGGGSLKHSLSHHRISQRALRTPGGTLIFYSYVGSGPASTIHPKIVSGITSTPKIFEILATPKNIPHSVP